MQPIPIVYEEPHFLLVNKPAALFSQAAVGIDSLQTRLIQQLKARDQHPGEPFIGLPHRLDRGTSGIMLIARNQRALKRFGEQFQSRKVIKHYIAVVERLCASAAGVAAVEHNASISPGEPTSVGGHEQRWEDYLRKIPGLPQAEIVTAGIEGAKLAVARAECLHTAQGLSLLRIQLETGRMHQIRIQAASRGLPVMGDASYGAQLPWNASTAGTPTLESPADVSAASLRAPAISSEADHSPAAENASPESAKLDADAHPPIALHAWSLEFRHPQTAKSLRFVAPLPANWQQLPAELLDSIAGLH